MPYCSNCGAQIQQGVNFCNNCGQRATAPEPQNRTPPPPPSNRPDHTGEPVLTAISGLRQGILGRKNYVMLITGQRLVFMELTASDIKELNRQAKEESKNRGEGMFKRLSAGFTASMNTGIMFKGTDIKELIIRYPNTFSVPAQSVKELRIKSQGGDSDSYELRIKSSGYNEKFRISKYEKEQDKALKSLLGGRYKSSTWFF